MDSAGCTTKSRHECRSFVLRLPADLMYFCVLACLVSCRHFAAFRAQEQAVSTVAYLARRSKKARSSPGSFLVTTPVRPTPR